ncbi:sulfate adenylyltransferase subunit CysN [Agrobacterium sp. fls2-241-TYG-188a]|uniref:sulfate adenylyltransferase subunit CysN n=1 Tax=Agrobacterium sp. fls2-241-TYG-188a TaxID=3040275 RepID=UPI00254B04F9|nr:sulfate adenylyltransferase subunit CysN [Agrobacterium sp. fls2-241-TYG-188a]
MPLIPDSSDDVTEYLRQQEQKSLLRVLTCGSVDDGKSTLIGRLLYDSKQIFEDQLVALRSDSARHGTAGEHLDFALLVDGLQAEREQGITIDVAYRFFATERRKFIVADTPGHEEYTRNMATGASTADLAIVLVDARHGILPQTRRHSFIVSLLGVRHIVLAVNKIDMVGFEQARYETIVADYRSFVAKLGFETVVAIPLSARFGDNIIAPSPNTPWYSGAPLLRFLEEVGTHDQAAEAQPFRFPVQYVTRPNLDFRGFSGEVAAGSVCPGDPVMIAKSGRTSKVREIVTMDGPIGIAQAGQPVTVVLDDQVDVSRGDILCKPGERPQVSDQIQAHVIWFDSAPMIPGRSYVLRTECDEVAASISSLRYSVDINTLSHMPARTLAMNEIGVCNISLQAPIAFDPYRQNRTTGNFILIDRFTNSTVGSGMIDFALHRSDNIKWQAIDVSKASRASQKGQAPRVIWFTGLSGSGKSTIANCLERRLQAEGFHTMLLDGDNVRHGLNRDLGFTDADRVENIRRIAEVAKLMTEAGLIVIVSFISPFRSERQMARQLMAKNEFIEVFVDTPLEECIRRDPKGLYKRALAGEIRNFTGLDSIYEPPEEPEIQLKTATAKPEDLADQIASYILDLP